MSDCQSSEAFGTILKHVHFYLLVFQYFFNAYAGCNIMLGPRPKAEENSF